MRPQHYFLLAPLAVCALILLSACGGPTPIAGRVTETAMPTVRPDTPASPAIGVPSTEPSKSTGSPTADVSPSPAATATDASLTPPPDTPTPTATPTETPTVTPTPEALTADTPAPDDAKPARPTETPAVLNIKPPEISGYLLKQGPDGGWVYKDKSGKEVAHTVTYSWEGLNWKKTVQRGALVVNDEKLMAYLLKTASEGRAKSEIPLFPLPFNPEGLELREVDAKGVKGHTVIIITGGLIQEVFQPFPTGSPTLFNDFGFVKAISISPSDDFGLKVYASDFRSPLKPFYQSTKPFLALLASNFSRANLPDSFGVPAAATAEMTIGSPSGGKPLTLGNFASYGGLTVAVGNKR